MVLLADTHTHNVRRRDIRRGTFASNRRFSIFILYPPARTAETNASGAVRACPQLTPIRKPPHNRNLRSSRATVNHQHPINFHSVHLSPSPVPCVAPQGVESAAICKGPGGGSRCRSHQLHGGRSPHHPRPPIGSKRNTSITLDPGGGSGVGRLGRLVPKKGAGRGRRCVQDRLPFRHRR